MKIIAIAAIAAVVLAGCASQPTATPVTPVPAATSAASAAPSTPPPSPTPSPVASSSRPMPTAAPTQAKAPDDLDIVCGSAGDILAFMPILTAVPPTPALAADLRQKVKEARTHVKLITGQVSYLEDFPSSLDEATAFRVQTYPAGLRRLELRLGLYNDYLKDYMKDGRLSTAERLDLQDQGEKIIGYLNDSMDWSCQ